MADWETVQKRDKVTVLRKRPQKASDLKSEQAVNKARREGIPVETQQKWGAGQNKQHATTKNTAKLDRETEELKHETVSLEIGKLIQQHRNSKGWSQKDLATKVNEKQQVINDYEAGRAIPNQTIISKLERVLGVKLRGTARPGPNVLPPGKK